MKKDSAEKDLLYRSKFEIVEPYLYLLPFFLGVAIFTLYPVVNVVLMSFQEDYSMLTRTYSGWGFGNYIKTLNDPNFWQAIGNTLHYVLLVVPISLVLSLIIANLLNQKLKGSAFFQSIFFMPMVTSVTAVGLAWKFMFNNRGVINYLLGFFGVEKAIPWLRSAQGGAYNMTALVIFGIWNILPFTIILLLSGLQNIDPQYRIAAKVDAATNLRIFFRITVPLLAPTIFLVCIVNTISCFKVFSELYPLFGGNPGAMGNLYTVVYYIRTSMMQYQDYGVASAAALILFLFIFVFTMAQTGLRKFTERRKVS